MHMHIHLHIHTVILICECTRMPACACRAHVRTCVLSCVAVAVVANSARPYPVTSLTPAPTGPSRRLLVVDVGASCAAVAVAAATAACRLVCWCFAVVVCYICAYFLQIQCFACFASTSLCRCCSMIARHHIWCSHTPTNGTTRYASSCLTYWMNVLSGIAFDTFAFWQSVSLAVF
ncbi:unnamed protein product [Ceratitis capitata]|uniref:(Mediterranean fruit fly) hypothetical protein n=1 Tax=Ceratitis capitata TaxID=7213 RepID=A0A811V8I3_CERCA|nr:unnamed protein product [Ceratitis capitata]